MRLDKPSSIVRNPAPLSEDYIPLNFPGREKHHKELTATLIAGFKKQIPAHVWIHGQPGSGKSSIIRKVLCHLEEQRIKTAYVNCWTSQTFFSVLETIIQELRALVGEKREITYKFERLSRISKDNPLAITLDEIDQLFLKDRNATLYNLSRLKNVCLISLNQSRQPFLSLDTRVQSRLQPHFIEFPRYSNKHLLQILEERAQESLETEAWCRKDLEKIVESSQGDARIAIQTLRIAAYNAESDNASHIRENDIEQGFLKSSELRKQYLLKTLSEHHRLLYQIVKENEGISSATLWTRYNNHAKKYNLESMARRTFNHYKLALLRNKLLNEIQGKGRRNQRVLKVVE